MIIKGRIKSGYGNASFWVKKINNIFKQRYKEELFPGTLNVELEEPYILSNTDMIEPGEYNGQYVVYVKEAMINGYKVHIVRTERNNLPNGDHSLNVIEIVSRENLRETLHLENDDIVNIEI